MDSHLAWNVAYAPGAIEARGYKGGKLVKTVKRETTGTPVSLAITADLSEISADGEDVAMFAVKVRDAQGRVVPITDNEVTFKVTGAGKHPLYAELISAVPHARGDKEAFRGNLRGYGMTPTEDPEVLWNFEKFLVSARGEVVDRFAPDITPDDEQITAAIERELQAG